MPSSFARKPQTFDRAVPPNPSYPLEFVDHLESMLHDDPFGFIELAAKVISAAEDPIGLAHHLCDESVKEITALGAAMSELLIIPKRRPAETGFPLWLERLDEADMIAAACRTESPASSTSYLLEIELAGGEVGTVQARVDHQRGERISNVFVSATPLAETVRIIDAPTNLLPRVRYGPVETAEALKILGDAVLAYKVDPLPVEAFNPWPANRSVLEWLVARHGS